MTRRLAGALLIRLMAIGSVLLWIGIPVGWLYLVSPMGAAPQAARRCRGTGRCAATARSRGAGQSSTVCSVALAVVCFAIWFLVFAGSSLPT
jgi:hypothetical protein